MTKSRRCCVLAAIVAACSPSAFGDVFSFEGGGYVAGGGLNNVVDANGNPWQKEGTDTRDFVLDNTVFSPYANSLIGVASTQSARFDLDGNGSARLGMDLAAPITSGIVTLQYDVRNDPRAAGSNLLRLNVLNRAGVLPGGGVVNADIVWQPYVQNGGGGAAAQNGFFGLAGRGELDGIGVFGDCGRQPPGSFPDVYCNSVFSPQLLPEATGGNDRWYRIKMYFDLSDATYPGRLLYAAIYDINCGSEIQIAENHVANQLTAIKKLNNAGAAEVRSFQLRCGGGDTAGTTPPIDQRMWIDNLVVAAAPGFVLPPPTGGGPPVAATTLNADAGTQAVTTAFTLPTNVGDAPSLARVGSTVYTMDGSNGLTTWTGGGVSTFTDDAAEVNFGTDGTGVLVPDGAGNLYFVADGTSSTAHVWPDLLRYDAGTGTWSVVCDGDATGGNVGNHSASLLTIGGVAHVVEAWTGASYYTSLNANGTRTPQLVNVGNRWAGACTEAFAHGSSGNELFFLQQTDATGNPISNNTQAYNAIYRAGLGLGCDAFNSSRFRVSPSARLLPWVTNAADGGNVNRHQMEYEPARNRVWVLRAGGSNQIGIYDTTQDRFGVLKLMNGANPLAIDHADLLLSNDGSQMYIMSRGEGAVYAVSTNITFVNTGACLSGGTCTLLTSAACASLPGTYLGDNQVCPPPGACCNGHNCTITFAITCAGSGGIFQGANSVCSNYSLGTGGAFEDIVATGTQITTLGDDDSVGIPIGFSFTHYGNTYTNVRVGANGYLSFSGTDGADSWTAAVGSTSEPNDIIAGFWEDLSPQVAPGTVHYEVRGVAPARRLIVQWTNCSQFTTGAPVDSNTFQVVLFEGSNNAEVHFGAINVATPATTGYGSGVENADGTRFVSVPQASIVSNASIQFTQAPNPCRCLGDINNSGTVSVQDIFDFLALYFSNDPRADINHSGTISVQDIFDFLSAYFSGCA